MPRPGERLTRATDATPIKLEGCALPPYMIIVQDGWNPRNFDNPTPEMLKADEELERSIRARIAQGLPGLLNPIKVKYVRSADKWRGKDFPGGNPLLVDGERRLRAYLRIWDSGLHANIPLVDTFDKGETEAQLRAATIIANDNFPLTPLEIGLQCKVMRDGCLQSVKWIADNIGKSVRFVTEAIALHDAPEEAKALVQAGEVTPAAVRGALKEEEKAAKIEHRAPEPERIVAPLKERVAARPVPPAARQDTLPDVPPKPAQKPPPLARTKAPSAKEQVAKSAPKLLELADAMYAELLNLCVELPKCAAEYAEGRGLKA